MGINEELTQEIITRLLTVANPDKIILFGSAATGQMNKDSDIDLLVLEKNPGSTRQKSVLLRASLGNLDFSFDIIVMSTKRFEESKNIIGGIAYPANKYGKVIYEAA